MSYVVAISYAFDNPAPLPRVATPPSLKKVKGRHDPKEALRIARTGLAADQQRGVFQGLDGVLKGSLFLNAFCDWQVHWSLIKRHGQPTLTFGVTTAGAQVNSNLSIGKETPVLPLE